MKKYLHFYWVLSFILGLTACSSSPVAVTYYRLNSTPTLAATGNTIHKANKTLLIEQVKLAGFLRQSGMVIQQGKNQLYLSKAHLWAERLDDALPKVLQAKLQQQSSEYEVFLNPVNGVDVINVRLRLRIDSLHANDAGEVITEGRFQIISTDITQLPLVKYFYFKRDLEHDGHSHVVAKIEILVALIAEDILSTLNEAAMTNI